MEPVKKWSSGSSCSSWTMKDLKQVPKKSDLSKLYKRIEKASKRFFHPEKDHTFIPSSQQICNISSDSGVPPPYPIDNSFGAGPGYSLLPVPQSAREPPAPPTYGWALNGIPSSNNMPDIQGELILDIGENEETAGSGFDYLTSDQNDDYLKPNEHGIKQSIQEQEIQKKRLEMRVYQQFQNLQVLLRDNQEMDSFHKRVYKDVIDKDVAMLENQVAELEKKHAEMRKKFNLPPPRPPPPRSLSQEGNNERNWTCCQCERENEANEFRCIRCILPRRMINPTEAKQCGCKYCVSIGNT